MHDSSNETRDSSAMTIWEHMDELAKRLKVALYTVILFTVAMMVIPTNLSFLSNPFEFYDPLIGLVLRTIRAQILPPNARLIGLGLTAPIELYFTASVVVGVGFSLPIVAYEFYRFIDPALYPHEKRDAYPFVLSFMALFVIGVLFGYLVAARFLVTAMFPFFTAVGAEQIISVMDFYTTVFSTTLLTGLIFTTPVVFVLLVRFGIVGTSIVTRNRRYIYAALFVLVAMTTADGGPVGDALLYLPMITLLELGVFFAKRYEKSGKVKKAAWLQRTHTCRLCATEISNDSPFCPGCGKAQT